MPNRETFLQIADRLLKTNGPLSFRERLALTIESAHEEAVASEREACASVARNFQGKAIAPFESCDCGKRIAESIEARK